MEPLKETVVLNGFWSEFQADALPTNGDVYFAFTGRVIRKPLCVIDSLLYIGPRYVNDEDMLQREKVKEFSGMMQLEGELFFVSGSMSEHVIDKELLFSVLKAYFMGGGNKDLSLGLQTPIVIQLVGKIPRLFSGRERIVVDPSKGFIEEVK